MTREMLDACNPDNIPTGTPIVAGYIDGLCKWPQSAWDRLSSSIQVRISSLGTNGGQVLDVEPGNPNARQAVYWAQMRRAFGQMPTIYTAEWAASTKGYGPIGYAWADCIREFDAAGEPQPNYWIAPVASGIIPPGAVAVQHTYKGTVDVNSVVDYWPGVDGGIDMTLDDLDGIAARVNGIPARQPDEPPGSAFVRLMQATLTAAQTTLNVGNDTHAKVAKIAAATGADPAALAAAVAKYFGGKLSA